jgi:hypothetical protein
MKKILVGATLAAFAFAPAIGSADCGPGHDDKASMASSQPAEKPQVAQSQSPRKASPPVVAKTSATKQVKHVHDKTAKTDTSTVVARNN